MPTPKRTTLRSLASEAGVSVTTVSLALRDSREISEAVRRRIHKLAKARGYRVNPLVSALFSQLRSRKPRGDHAVIAYLNTWWPKRLWETCNTKTGQFRGAERRAAELGFRLENFWLHEPGMSPARLAQILKARGIRGVLIGPVQNQDKSFVFPCGDFALATMGYSLHSPPIARACHAHFRGMYRAVNELLARGYRRIGYITSKDFEERVDSLWGGAYRFNQGRMPVRERIEPLVFDGDADVRTLDRWLRRARPEAVINALPAVYEQLRELEIEIPGQLGFAHLDLPLHLKAANVSGIDQLSETVGASALDLVAGQLYTDSCGIPEHPVTQLIEGVWVDGATLRGEPLTRTN